MKAGGGVIVTGEAELDRLLRSLPLKVQKKLSRQATRKSAKEIALPYAKSRVPVDEGDLLRALVVRAMKRSRNRFGHTVGTKEGAYQGDQFYGSFPEYGTKHRQHKSGKSVGRIQPGTFAYLRPSIYDNQSQIHGNYVTAMRQLIAELPTVK